MTKKIFWLEFFCDYKLLWQKNYDQTLKKNHDQIKKKMWPNSKKNCDQTINKTKKTSRESRKAALRVGWLSRCWGDKTQKLKLWKKNLKTETVTKLKNSNCDKTHKLKLWQNSKTETETKHKNFKCDKIQKLQLLQN